MFALGGVFFKFSSKKSKQAKNNVLCVFRDVNVLLLHYNV